ncbi:hypothetical protein MLD38_011173 [Melastoma candidum]|uniref:Uncharacterized protein n=1 Tax=Melastoma candidum TaxID=119954 RepID=A0ACB9R281_9MYRT|nr:hypothetical protein MLD38_011173 [Melastoma candidum]
MPTQIFSVLSRIPASPSPSALSMATSPLTQLAFARQWVAVNVAPFYPQTNIIRVLMGNEIFHSGDKQLIVNLIPAMRTLHNALVLAGFRHIQVSTPQSLGIIGPFEPPSVARFKPGYQKVLRQMLQFLRESKSPFMVNPYPYFAYSPSQENYAAFKPNRGYYDRYTRITYTNMFDAMMDAIYSSMKALGFADVPIVVAETGWPSLGDAGEPAPTLANAISYNQNLLAHVMSGKGTPLMPNRRIETYIFALFQENSKPGPLAERNWGLFNPDFSPVYHIGLLHSDQSNPRAPRHGGRARPVIPRKPRGNVQWCVPKAGASDQALQANIDYVCSKGIDCRPIQAGGPCFDPDNIRSHASYVMNSFYRVNGAHPFNCDFADTGLITTINPSKHFPINNTNFRKT